MGTIKTTNIEPIADNGTVTLGSSGDTFTVPSGVTVNMSSATQTGVGGVNTPAFHAYISSDQSISDSTQTLLNYDTEIFDTAGAFNTSTKKFQPQTAGKYVVYAQMTPNNVADHDTFELQMYKNAVSTSGTQAIARGRNEAHETKYLNRIVEFNGSSDFVYMYTFQTAGASKTVRGTRYDSFFGAYKIIE